MKLDLSSFQMAITSLESALVISAPNKLTQFDVATQKLIKAGVVQNFEFAYELSYKMLKRYLEMTAPNPEIIDQMSFQNLIRTGSEQRLLLNGWDIWKGYRKARGTTSHTYDETKATEVLAWIPDFLREVQFLFAELEKRNSEID